MTHEQMHDFAATKEKGLPGHVKKKKAKMHKDVTGAVVGKRY